MILYRKYWTIAFLLWFFMGLGFGGAKKAPFRSRKDAAESFAALLKIPPGPPNVSVQRRKAQEEKDGMVLEDITWESLDGERPTAYLIRPARISGRLPAVICLHGTGGSRESETTINFGIGEWTRPGENKPHQRLLGWARELARQGYVTLALTQRGLDIRTPDTNDQAKNLLVHGRTLMGAIVYEIRQSVTYLQQRSEVDSRRIGMAGLSFGGITTFCTWLVDDRIAAAASICGGVGSVDVLLQKGTPAYHGLYWWLPGLLLWGDQGDFAAAMAPRPLMLWAPLQDVGMPREGVDRFVQQVEPAYVRSGLAKNLAIYRFPGEHEFSLDAFASLEKFFDAHLRN
jgi:dienelactone hydrolase